MLVSSKEKATRLRIGMRRGLRQLGLGCGLAKSKADVRESGES